MAQIIPAGAKGPAIFQPGAPCSGKHRMRLLVGEGNFSFALALINKHDTKKNHGEQHSLAKSIIATENKSEILCQKCVEIRSCAKLANLMLEEGESPEDETAKCPECQETDVRIKQLQAKGANVRLGVDATQLKETFPDQTFKRIHWNGPHDGSQFKEQTLPNLMLRFFRSCATVQKIGGRVHVSIPQPPKKPDGTSGEGFYQGYVYHLVKASASSGYMLIRKRKFDPARYPGYVHQQTKRSEAAPVFEKAKEFVFEKIDPKTLKQLQEKARTDDKNFDVTKVAQSLLDMSPKKETSSIKVEKFYQQLRTYYICASDDDSSDYAASD